MDSVAAAGLAGRQRSTAFLVAARRLAAALWEQAGIRLELFTLELAEERTRLVGVLIAIAMIVVCAALAIAFGGLAALIAAWDTPYRVTVAVGFAIGFAIVAAGGWLALRHLLGQSSPLFRHSLAEWKRDVDDLRPGIEPEA